MGRLPRWFAGALLAPVLAVATLVAVPWHRTDDRVREIRFSGATSRGSVVWTRTDPDSGEAVFLAVYATHVQGGS